MDADTQADERDSLLPSLSFSTSYQSFDSPRESNNTPASECGLSEEGSFKDALPYLSSTLTAVLKDDWLAKALRSMRAWFGTRLDHTKSLSDPQYFSWGRNVLAVIMMGIAAAVVATIVDVAESRIFDWKYGICTVDWTASKPMCCSDYDDCPEWQTWSQIAGISNSKTSAFNFLIYLILVSLLSSLSYFWTSHTQAFRLHHLHNLPDGDVAEKKRSYFAAAGSGVSDVKQAIYGIREEAPWAISTLIMKTMGLIMSTSSGLCVGKEGPYVHMSASAANLVNQSVPARFRMSSRKALSIGSAAGMAVAFGTPLTGMVFVMEEYGRSFETSFALALLGGGMVAVAVLSGFNPYGGSRTVPWEVRYHTSWSSAELILFIIVGVASGILAATFIGGVRLWSLSFRRITLIKRWPLLDILLVALVTALSSFWTKYLRYGTSELLSDLTRDAPSEQVTMSEGGALGLSLLMKLALTVITTGLQIPQGIYMPSMALGSLLGRCIGDIAIAGLGSVLSPDPAVYAMAGAGAVMAGTTHLQLSIIIMIFESTRSWDYLVPFALSICTAKAVASFFERQNIYALFATLQGQPSLRTTLNAHDTRVEDVWDVQDAATPCLNLVSGLEAHVRSLRAMLDSAELSGSHFLPILKYKSFIGCISNHSLRDVLSTLEGGVRVLLEYETGNTPRIVVSLLREPSGASHLLDMETQEEQYTLPPKRLALHYPAVFDCCSTLSSILNYFEESDADYICVAIYGTVRTVVTRERLADWAMSVSNNQH